MSKVVKQLNQLQADANSLYLAFHSYHWNVKGYQFFAIHKYTEEVYEELASMFDDVAERALQLKGKPIICQKELLELAKAPVEIKDSYTVEEVVKNSKKAFKYLVDEFKELDKLSSDENDTTTATYAQDKIADLEKKIWMLESVLG